MQHSTLLEAEQLIQSWLHSDDEHVFHPPSSSPLGGSTSHPLLPLTSDHSLLPPTTNIASDLRPTHRSEVETSALSSHSHPHLTSHDDLDWKYSSFKPDTTLLPSSGLLSSSADLLSGSHLAAWMNSNSKPDTRAGNPSSSGCRRKVSKSQLHSHALSNCLLTSDDRNSNSDTFSTHGKAEDLLSTLDWGKGEVEDNVHSIVQALMKKTVRGRKGERGGRRRGHHDPRVTMEMRHKQVHERRRARDEAKQKDMRQRQQQKEAWQEAERLVREGEREEGRRRRREEALVAEQMAAIRKHVQEETERKRREHSVGVSSGKPRPSPVLDVSKRDAVMVCAGECVRGEERERKRRENRAELVRQLEEIELLDRKERSKVLRHAVSMWYSVVAEQRAKLRRAAAWWAWHVLVRVWGVWRGYVRGKREKREQDRVTREMKREQRLIVMATKHYHQCLLQRCVSGWMVKVGRERGRREREEEERRHRERVETFLAAATSSVAAEETQQEGKMELLEKEARNSPIRRAAVVEGRRGRTPQPIMWQVARKHVDELLSSVAPPMVNEGEEKDDTSRSPRRSVCHRVPDTPGRGRGKGVDGEGGKTVARGDRGRGEGGDGGKEVVEGGRGGEERDTCRAAGKPITYVPPAVSHPQPKPVTKSIPMSGMQARTQAIAERRKRRQERETERVREREERATREEEERRERERQEREAIAARRREERKIAKQRELERLERQRREKEQLSLSVAHYTASLLRGRGLRPWRQFMEEMRGQRRRAEQFHLHWRLQCALGKWREVVARRLSQREQAADSLCHRMLKRRAWQGWREYVRHCQWLEEACEGWARELVSRAVFRAWLRATTTARREGWERERRAKMCHTRQLKRAVLLSWQRYVPLSREEHEREVRRAELRRKVTQWLPDYRPQDFDKDSS